MWGQLYISNKTAPPYEAALWHWYGCASLSTRNRLSYALNR
jgi:hypothetical protein